MSERIAILLCTYNGEKFVSEQMDSFFAQKEQNWELWISDDGSVDNTIQIIERYRNRGKAINLITGPHSGFVKNFLSLMRHDAIRGDYYALSDQDDIWDSEKLSRAKKWLMKQDPTKPALYYGRTRLADENGRFIGLSPVRSPFPTFQLNLAQCLASGNTMVFNQAAKDLLCAGKTPDIFAHDWWLAILVSGCGGAVFWDSQPSLAYRQHSSNLVGFRTTPYARIKRYFSCLSGESKKRNEQNFTALASRLDILEPSALESLCLYLAAHNCINPIKRLYYLHKSGVRRESCIETAGLLLAALINQYP